MLIRMWSTGLRGSLRSLSACQHRSELYSTCTHAASASHAVTRASLSPHNTIRHVAASFFAQHTRAMSSAPSSNPLHEASASEHAAAAGTSMSEPVAIDRGALLSTALNHVATHGWSMDALVAAAKEHGLSPAVVGMLGAGEADLVHFFVKKCNNQLKQALLDKQTEIAAMRTTQKIRFCVQHRLEMLGPVISSWPQALSLMAQPGNLPTHLQHLYELVDMTWQATGDESVDSSWYTKRLLLSGVFTTTELYMLSDYSPGFHDTWQSLDRRLADIASTARATKDLSQFASSVTRSAAGGLASLMEVADRRK